MSELKLYGMKAAYDEIIASAVKRQHEPARVVGDLLTAEVTEKQARSIRYQITIAKLPLAKLAPEPAPGLDPEEGGVMSRTSNSATRRSTRRWSATLPAATSSTTSAMSCWSAGPAPASRIWRSRWRGR